MVGYCSHRRANSKILPLFLVSNTDLRVSLMILQSSRKCGTVRQACPRHHPLSSSTRVPILLDPQWHIYLGTKQLASPSDSLQCFMNSVRTLRPQALKAKPRCKRSLSRRARIKISSLISELRPNRCFNSPFQSLCPRVACLHRPAI
jgi:hypothetical protein